MPCVACIWCHDGPFRTTLLSPLAAWRPAARPLQSHTGMSKCDIGKQRTNDQFAYCQMDLDANHAMAEPVRREAATPPPAVDSSLRLARERHRPRLITSAVHGGRSGDRTMRDVLEQ